MSSTDPKEEESVVLVHTKKPNCPLCTKNKETFGDTAKTCYQSASPNAGENTKTFLDSHKPTL